MNEEVQRFLEELFAESDLNRLPGEFGKGRIFAGPLIGISRGDDPIFWKFKEVVHPDHLTPGEMWMKNGLPGSDDLPRQLRILSIIFPYDKAIQDENRGKTELPAEVYCVARNFANAFMKDVLNQTLIFFRERKYRAVAGSLSPAYQIFSRDLKRIASTWSERHIAFAAGLGTFSLHEALITEAGCNVRIASVVTEALLRATTRKDENPYGNCLYYAQKKCKKCIDRCPAGAISEEGHDKVRCYSYGRVVAEKMQPRLGPILKPHYRLVDGNEQISYPVGCALCQFDVPCMDKNPRSFNPA